MKLNKFCLFSCFFGVGWESPCIGSKKSTWYTVLVQQRTAAAACCCSSIDRKQQTTATSLNRINLDGFLDYIGIGIDWIGSLERGLYVSSNSNNNNNNNVTTIISDRGTHTHTHTHTQHGKKKQQQQQKIEWIWLDQIWEYQECADQSVLNSNGQSCQNESANSRNKLIKC